MANCLCCYWFLNSSRCIFPFLPDRHYQSGRNIRNHISKMKGHLSEKHSTSVRFSRKNHAGIESPVFDLPQKSLHTGAFTHRSFYIEKPLHRAVFTNKRFYTQKFLHTETYFYITKNFLHANVFAQRVFCTETFLHTDTITRSNFYAQQLLTLYFLHKEILTHRSFYAGQFLHTHTFFAHRDFHFTHRSFYKDIFLHRAAFTHRRF